MAEPVLPGTRQEGPEAAPKCPYCGSTFTDQSTCPVCGIICSRCGTPYKTEYCPECHSSSPSQMSGRRPASSPEAPQNTIFGEVAPDLRETPGIFGGRWVGRREWNMMKGTFATAEGKQVHDRALEAVSQLGLSSETQAMLLDRVERVARSLMKRFRSCEKAVMFALSVEAKTQGIPIVSVQNALGRAGFTIRFGSILVKVWTTEERGNSSTSLVKVNDQPRASRAWGSSSAEEDARLLLAFGRGSLLNVRVPLLLTDSLSAGAGKVVLEFAEGSEIVSYEPKFGAKQTGRAGLRLRLRPEKAFGLFKVEKQAIISASSQNLGRADPKAALDLYMRRFLYSRFPVSVALMGNAGCLRTVENRFVELFRARMKNANGQMPQRMALGALFDADAEVFHLLPPVQKRVARLLIATMNLSPEDRRYIGGSGLLLPSEAGGRPALRGMRERCCR